ncbi:MAG: enoyl-CoA hydratase/isomerase family protein [bacterium]
MSASPSPYVELRARGAVATVEFFHPEHNSLPAELLRRLSDEIVRAGDDSEIRVIVLQSAGARTFCAGANFAELAALTDAAAGARFFGGFGGVINAMRKCPKFIVGRVQGKAVGGGVGLAAATDYCLASRHGAIKLSELSIGIGAFVVGPAIERKIGLSAMSQLTLAADAFHDAEWAREKGLYAQVHDTAEQLDAAVQSLAQKLAAYDPQAMRELKRTLWHDAAHWDELLAQRAAISGTLAVAAPAQQTIRALQLNR